MGSGNLIKRAISKHGVENFTKEILFVLNTREEANSKEKELVIIGVESYNLCSGGHGSFDYINKNGLVNHKEIGRKGGQKIKEKCKTDPIFKAKILDTFKKHSKKRIAAYKLKYPNGIMSFLGKKHKEETKKIIGQKNSVHQKGSKNSQYGSMWVTNGIKNKKIYKNFLEIPSGYYRGRVNGNKKQSIIPWI